MVLSGLLLSAAIELTQFFMRRGLFEFVDIIGNTLGVVIGVGIFSAMKRVSGRKWRKELIVFRKEDSKTLTRSLVMLAFQRLMEKKETVFVGPKAL